MEYRATMKENTISLRLIAAFHIYFDLEEKNIYLVG
jgi:hypothetical protein